MTTYKRLTPPIKSDDGYSCSELPKWYLLTVRARNERKVAQALVAKGFEAFVPMRSIRRQWSDRLKTVDEPLFACNVFCRTQNSQWVRALKTPGVFDFYKKDGRPVSIPDQEVETLRRVTSLDGALEAMELPLAGTPVEVVGDKPVRGILVERGPVCRIAICLDSTGRCLKISVPFSSIRELEGNEIPIHIPFDIPS